MFRLLTQQIRVIGALVLRETRATFGGSQIGYLWALFVPIASVSVLVTIFTFAGRQAPFGPSLALFFALGLLLLEYYKKLANMLMGAFQANSALLTYPVIKALDTIFARFILISATYYLIIAIFIVGLIGFALADEPYELDQCFLAIFVTGLLGLGVGCCNAVVYSLWSSWKNVEKILTTPLFFLSGIFYVPSNMPSEAIEILKWNPVLHLIEWIRQGYYINYSSLVLDKMYPVSFACIMIFLGLAGERLFRKKRV